jgi:phosphate transport system substrate-binding protein
MRPRPPSFGPAADADLRLLPRLPRFILAFLLFAALGVAPAAGCRPKLGAKETVNVIGSTTVLPIAQAAAEVFNKEHEDVEVLVQGGGSSAGIEAAATGRAQIGTSSRELKDEEKALGLSDIPVAADVIAVIVHPANPVDGLTLDELKGIFTGRIRDWREVGGPDLPIDIVNRDEASGTREAFFKMVLGEEPFASRAAVLPGTGQVRAVVATSKGAIGYMSLGYVTDQVKALEVDGVAPTLESVREGSYKLKRWLHFFVKGTPDAGAKAYIDFVLSDRVQKDIVGHEFIPVSAVKK